MKLTPQTRFLQMQEAPIVDVDRRQITFPFSSEAPIQRWYGNEILAHDAESADMTRLNDGAPVLFDAIEFDPKIATIN